MLNFLQINSQAISDAVQLMAELDIRKFKTSISGFNKVILTFLVLNQKFLIKWTFFSLKM